MVHYDINALHNCVLNILKGIDETCRQHNLRYYIFAGTLLGAVRHKGFIPWDDDMDIAMPRPDYDKLIEHQKEWLPANLEMVCNETDKDYPQPFAKIQDANTTIIERIQLPYLGGAYIDVFPLDGMTKSPIKQRLHFFKYWYWKRMIYFCCRNPYKHGHGPSCWLPLIVRRCYTLQYIQAKMRNLQKAYDYEQSPCVVDHDDGLAGIFDKKIFGKPIPYEFENQRFMGPEKGMEYLRLKYGDYMTIPKNAQQRQHNFDILKLDLPYRKYKEQEKK